MPAPSVGVKTPPTMPPTTTTGIARTGSARQASIAAVRNENASPVSLNPRFTESTEATVMKPSVRRMPGTTPAMNSPPTETAEPAISA